MICQVPVAVATPVPICVVPSNRVIVRPAVAVPLKAGAKTLVILSAVDLPLSDVAIRSGTDGAGAAHDRDRQDARCVPDVACQIGRSGTDGVNANA